jgi:uncharacterized protein
MCDAEGKHREWADDRRALQMKQGIARRRALRLVALSFALANIVACASHSDRTLKARSALDAGKNEKALELFNKELKVDSARELPPNLSGDQALLVLDRAMVLQQLRRFEDSSRDLEAADKQIQLLDFSHSTADTLGKYLFSDSSGPYQAPLYEKLLINTVNMLNYLERRDLNGARVEARRLAVMQASVGASATESDTALLGPGNYLAGFIFERSNQSDEALRFYDEGLAAQSLNSFKPAIAALARKGGYRSPRITAIVNEAGPAATPDAAAATPETGEVLIVVSYGRVPAKIAERVPIGLALTYAADAINPDSARRAQKLAAQGLVTWVNYPRLGPTTGNYSQPRVTLDGAPVSPELALSVDREARTQWDKVRGITVASAITRMIARVVAGQATEKVTNEVAGKSPLGFLLGLATQATLTATDIPDTRSWATLPARIAMTRQTLPAGNHEITVAFGGSQRRVAVVLPPGGWAVVSLTALGR